jgi:hypothetical protein
MRFIYALSLLALIIPTICDKVASIISEITPLITEIPPIISQDGGLIITSLANIINIYDPLSVVSNLSGVLASEILVIKAFVDELMVGALPLGAVLTNIVAEIQALVSNLVSQIVTKLDEIISSKPLRLDICYSYLILPCCCLTRGKPRGRGARVRSLLGLVVGFGGSLVLSASQGDDDTYYSDHFCRH